MDHQTAPSHGRGRPHAPGDPQAYEQGSAAIGAADFLFDEPRARLGPLDPDGRLLSASVRTGRERRPPRLGGPHRRSLATPLASHEPLPRTQPILACRRGPELPLEHVRAIWRAFANRHRFTSVLGSRGAILRPHVHAGRGAPPSPLSLIVHRRNLRPFPWGAHRGGTPLCPAPVSAPAISGDHQAHRHLIVAAEASTDWPGSPGFPGAA